MADTALRVAFRGGHDRETTATKLDTGQLRRLASEDPQFGYALALTMFQACAQRLQATRARLLDLYGSPP